MCCFHSRFGKKLSVGSTVAEYAPSLHFILGLELWIFSVFFCVLILEKSKFISDVICT